VTAPEASAPGTLVEVDGFETGQFDEVLPEKKKRVFFKVSQELEVNADLVATFRGVALRTPEGNVTVKSLKGAKIR
jgi:hypothetical protein